MHQTFIIAADLSTNLTDYLTATAPTIFAVYILVSLFKPYLEVWLKPTMSLHDPTIRALSVIFGIVIVVTASALLSTQKNPFTAQELFLALLQGAGAGLAAIGTYHLIGSHPRVANNVIHTGARAPGSDGVGQSDETLVEKL